MMLYLSLIPVLAFIMLLYFRIADYYNIVDKPNERSSHSETVIRGGGIIFIFTALITLFVQPHYWPLVSAIIIIGVISFLDDVFSLSNKLRISFHFFVVTIVLNWFDVFKQFPFYIIVLFYVVIIGIINAYNFMDGINGMTGIYSLVVLAGMQYINLKQLNFILADMIWLPMIACVVFLFFNFRKKAKCFAGDVGSVTIAMWIIILLLRLILISQNLIYILFTVIYGIDTVLTIIHRLLLKQNIFKAHRLHFYQLLVNEYKLPHLIVSLIYALLQTCVILLIIINPEHLLFVLTGCCLLLVSVYIIFKPKLMKLMIS